MVDEPELSRVRLQFTLCCLDFQQLESALVNCGEYAALPRPLFRRFPE
jgi:hypothetical protein